MGTITASVGRLGGANRPGDVKTIQGMLNRIPRDAGGPFPLLAVDALCGPRTVGAIQQFQARQFGWGKVDGRVDPVGPTLRKLQELTSSAPAAKLGVLTTGTRMACPHGGHVEAQLAAGPRLQAPDGMAALTPSDVFVVKGCPLTPIRCARVRWVESSRFLNERSVGLCISTIQAPTGPVVILMNNPRNRDFTMP